MDDLGQESLDERLERLERDVEELRREVRGRVAGVTSGLSMESGGGRDFSGFTVSESGTTRRFRLPFELRQIKDLSSGEWWLNKLGIGLLLFGVAFLFIYSVERGWIGPWMRVGFGAAIGAVMLVLGLHVYGRRRAFGQVLLGGGVGALYITVFAAFQLYSLVPYLAAFGFMVAVTLLAFVLSLRQDGASISLIGALGGLGTPFLLYTDSGSLGDLVLYTCLILAGTGAVYYRKGWVSLLAVSFVGGWLVLLIGYADSAFLVVEPSLADRRVLQVGVAFAWLLLWLVPVVRGITADERRVSTQLFVISTPMVSFAFTAAIWDLPASDLGWIALSAAVLYALAAFVLRKLEGSSRNFSYTHALVALMLLTLAAILMLEGDALIFTLAAEAAILHYVARRFSDGFISVEAHLIFFAVAVWLGARLVVPESSFEAAGRAVLDISALVDLLVIGLAFAASLVVMPLSLGRIYRIAAHTAVLAWLWRELSAMPGGEAYVTIAWGLYAVVLLVAGLRLDRSALIRVAMATLFLVAVKLFLVDLAEVEALWRVLLFLGFGVLFLSLSYYLQALWRPGRSAAEESGPHEGGERV